MSPPTTKSQCGRAQTKNCHSPSLARPLSSNVDNMDRLLDRRAPHGRHTLGEVSWKRFRLTDNPCSTLSHLFGRVMLRLDLSVAVNLNDDRLSVSPTFSPLLPRRPSAVAAVLSHSVDDGGGGDDDGRRGSRSLSPSQRQSA